jgi:hypothetical protein
MPHLVHVQIISDLLQTVKEDTLPVAYKLFGWDRHLLCPPVDTAKNLVDFALVSRHYMVGWHQRTLPPTCIARPPAARKACPSPGPGPCCLPLPLPLPWRPSACLPARRTG